MTTATIPTVATHPFTNRSLEILREFADLERYFDLLDAFEGADHAIAQALFSAGDDALIVEFAQAMVQERMHITLDPETELSEMGLIELLDPAKGYPTIELRAQAALLLLAIPTTDAKALRDHTYLASYLTDGPNIGLAVAMNHLRSRYGLGPTGW